MQILFLLVAMMSGIFDGPDGSQSSSAPSNEMGEASANDGIHPPPPVAPLSVQK